MATEKPLDEFFLFPRARRADDVQRALKHFGQLQPALAPARQDALARLLQISDGLAGYAHLVPHASPFEFILLTAVIDLCERVERLENHNWIHPPFP
jgi:hypothetical protein